MTERQLATVRKISNVMDIQNADKIQAYQVDGWVVVDGKGKYSIGDMIVYLEPDSFVPHALAPFLTKSGHTPKVYQDVEGQRLKTIKLRGVLSQGLILPLDLAGSAFAGSKFDEGQEFSEFFFEGSDVTELLGILKWEKELPACLRGTAKGNFPTEIPKTNQTRIQNLRNFDQLKSEHYWEVTEKLHGSSATYYLDANGVFHVCSRNIDLIETEGNSFWEIAKRYNIEAQLRLIFEPGEAVAIQGELVGPGINGNQYGLTEVDFYVFDMYSPTDGSYCPADCRRDIVAGFGLKHVPVIWTYYGIENHITVNQLLETAEGTSKLNSSNREGLVFKSNQDPTVSFKVVSNAWLLGGGDDQ